MHRVLQPLHELLEMCDSRLEGPNAILLRTSARRLSRLLSVCPVVNLADPRDQSLGRSHTSPPPRTLGRCRAVEIPPTLFLCPLQDHQRAGVDLLANQVELRLGSLPSAPHLITSPRGTTPTIPFGGPDSPPGCRAPAIDTHVPTAVITQRGI
jgi:hypothetical protein